MPNTPRIPPRGESVPVLLLCDESKLLFEQYREPQRVQYSRGALVEWQWLADQAP